MNSQPSVSIVIPARNESEDIANTIEACLALDYINKEILVVDDSTDDTPQIVLRYADRGVRLIHRDHNDNGCCGARNLGMQLAKGEIIIIFNADTLPNRDFIQRLIPHYENGADYVIVHSIVKNQDVRWGKYVAAADKTYPSPDPEWSEGFSCRRSAASKVGLIPGNFPVPFCRDYLLGITLRKAGFKKHIDMDIPVEHVVSDTFIGFWRNRVWRGSFAAPHAYYFRNMPLGWITLREALKVGRNLAKHLLVIPAFWTALKIAKHTPRGWREIWNMYIVILVVDMATVTGGIQGLISLLKVGDR